MKRLLYLFINRKGKINRVTVQGNYKVPKDEGQFLASRGPSRTMIKNMRRQGYSLCNWHIIEVSGPKRPSARIGAI